MQTITIGIDIGGTNVKYGFVSDSGKVIIKNSFSTEQFKTAEVFVDYLSKELKEVINKFEKGTKIKGIGIGVPNGNYYNGTIEFAPNLKWEGIIPLSDMFGEKTGYPVRLTNDANAATLGEMIYGNAKGLKNFLLITLGTGLGSGFVTNGKLILGHDGLAGELGHTTFDPKGRMCGCGRKGCLETYASATGIVRTVKELLTKSNEASILRDIPEDKITSKLIYEAAQKNDLIALTAFDYTGYVLGVMLANAVAITSPQVIFLLGGLANAGKFIFEPTKKYMEENLLKTFKNKVEIKPSALSESDAAILGAAALISNENN